MGLMNFWLKTNNNLVHKSLSKLATQIAEWASTTYPVIKAQYPSISEQDVFFKMLSDSIQFGAGSEDILKRSEESIKKHACISIESVCYFVGITLGPMKQWDYFRTLQWTLHMDAALYDRGFKRQAAATRRTALINRGIPVVHVDQFLSENQH